MASKTFEDARKSLSDLLGNLSFVKVVALQKSPTGAYSGEAVDLFKKDMVFFDKFGRSRSYLTVGPITLVQAAMGFDHPSSIPSVGEILVGTSVPNTRKSHLTAVLRGWSSDAKPLHELLRMVRFGTKKSEFENRSLLIQQAGILPGLQIYRDEIYMLARIVLWKNLRPVQVLAQVQDPGYSLKDPASEIEINAAKSLYLSNKAKLYVELVSVKLSCPEILETFLEGFKDITAPPPPVTAPVTAQVYGREVYPFRAPCAHTFDGDTCTSCSFVKFRPVSPSEPPAYNPTSPRETYNPTSPLPASPTYAFEEDD